MAGIIDNEYGIIDQRTICPYNKSHVVPVERMAKHLAKCRLQHSDANYKICPFDASHHVRKEDFQSHIVSCKGKDTVEKSMYKESVISLKSLPAHATVNSTMNEDGEENWDSDLPQATYDPKLEALYKPFFRQVPLELGAAGKKKWRKVEEERVARIKNGSCIEDLEFPTVEVGVETNQEITKQGDIMKEIPEASMSKHKSLMRVDLSPTLRNKTKANSGFKTGEGELCSSPLSATDSRHHKGKKKNKMKYREMASEVDSIFASFSKAKQKNEKENIQPSKKYS